MQESESMLSPIRAQSFTLRNRADDMEELEEDEEDEESKDLEQPEKMSHLEQFLET